jgi:hypothetical protein
MPGNPPPHSDDEKALLLAFIDQRGMGSATPPTASARSRSG